MRAASDVRLVVTSCDWRIQKLLLRTHLAYRSNAKSPYERKTGTDFSGSITCRTVSKFYRFVCPDSQACFRKRFLHTRKTMLPNKGTKVTISAHNNLLTELTFRLISKTNAMHHRITMPIMNSCQRPNIEVEKLGFNVRSGSRESRAYGNKLPRFSISHSYRKLSVMVLLFDPFHSGETLSLPFALFCIHFLTTPPASDTMQSETTRSRSIFP